MLTMSDRPLRCIKTIADTIVDVTAAGTTVEILQEPMPGKPAERYIPNVDRARTELGLEVWIDLREGIAARSTGGRSTAPIRIPRSRENSETGGN